MKATFLLMVCALMLSSAVWADKASYRLQLEEAVKLQEQRVHEIEASAQHDATIAKELFKLADDKLTAANQATAQAKAFNDAASTTTGAEKTELQGFAKEMQTYANYDRTFAEDRKKAAEIVDRQVHEMSKGLQDHRATIERMKAKLAALK